MSAILEPDVLPTHLDLPCEDRTVPTNHVQTPQAVLLTEPILPILDERHPGGDYIILHDNFLYWRLIRRKKVAVRAVAPDWAYIPGVPAKLDGINRRSYVLWQEHKIPVVVMEFVSGTGQEERDRTKGKGKFWVYEQALGVPYYVIFDPDRAEVEVLERIDGRYQPIAANRRGQYWLPRMGLALGLWEGRSLAVTGNWLRWWDANGRMLPMPDEARETQSRQLRRESQRAEAEAAAKRQAEQRAEQQRQHAEQECLRAELQRQRAEQEATAKRHAEERAEQQRHKAEQEHQRAESERQRAESERQRAESERQRAESERQRADALAAKLRELGIDPDA